MAPFFQILGNPAAPVVFTENKIYFNPLVNELKLQGIPLLKMPPQCKISKIFRREYIQQHLSSSSRLSNISSSRWKTFWSISLLAVQRNVIFRLLTGSIPHRAFLFRIFPTKFDSPLCPICHIKTDSTQHMIFFCPQKIFVWETIIMEFLWPGIYVEDIMDAIKFLEFKHVDYCRKDDTSAFQVIAITLAMIWKGHFRSSFDKNPFLARVILTQIRQELYVQSQEKLLKSRI